MKSYIFIVFLLTLTSCKTFNISNTNYKTSKNNIEIGSVGFSKSGFFENSFTTRAFPILNNKIRVSVEIVPFNKQSNKLYLKKSKHNQSQIPINYIDSLELKPELCIIRILDVNGFVSEINNKENKTLSDFLKQTKKSKIINSIVVSLPKDALEKIKQANTYYIDNTQEKKYGLLLFKNGKKTDIIDLQFGSVVLGYELSKCCWSLDKKGQWYLTDLINEYSSCNGNTSTIIREEKEIKNLLKL